MEMKQTPFVKKKKNGIDVGSPTPGNFNKICGFKTERLPLLFRGKPDIPYPTGQFNDPARITSAGNPQQSLNADGFSQLQFGFPATTCLRSFATNEQN
jgi:hypothetical protein